MITNKPVLVWPANWPRTAPNQRQPPRFRTTGVAGQTEVTLQAAIERLHNEVELLRARSVFMTSNLELRKDGLPRSDQPRIDDVGVAVYFLLKEKPTVLACDKWSTVAGNIAAIAAHIDALRGIARWGVGSVEQAFSGYTALPAPASSNHHQRAVT